MTQDNPTESKLDSDQEIIYDEVGSIDELKAELEKEKKAAADYENKFKRVLADFQNFERRNKLDIEQNINKRIDEFFKDFLQIVDDLERARIVMTKAGTDTSGLDSILKNINSFLIKNHVMPIESLGEIFDPNLHEALAVIEDNNLDEGTITKEIRKGYISQNRIIRPALVEVSKKVG